ncbi:MAG TPA: excinuclease ABC subunit UvrA [Pyrinomonadaceae bacterium]|jgi:excinuclease ABC subunit A|nr:excinuclease ABC subunit UvrA [Pyrinomonadaceae bacterium]
MPEEAIEVRGARVNNLKNISFSIPINQLTVVTGVSGSGKSSLAFDTIYAEGQRRYVESLSAYARQFLERMDKPDVDEVRGIAPAIAIRQKNSTRNPRSTVGTQTEVFDYLRLLYARVGITYCRVCGREVYKDSPESVADEILRTIPAGTRFYVLFPAHAGLAETQRNGAAETRKRGETAKKQSKSKTISPRQVTTAHVMSLMQRGFTRLYSAGQTIDLHSPDDYQLETFDDVFVLVDRLTAHPDIRQRLVDSLEICFQEGHGTANIETAESEPRRLNFSDRFECKYDGTVYAQPEPRLFSFNNPYGACPTCQGFGNTIGLDLDLVIPNPGLSLKDGAIEPWTRPQHEWAFDELKQFCKSEKISLTVPFAQLSRAEQKAIIEGKKDWGGVRGFYDWLETKKYKLHVRVFLSKYRGYTLCPDCGGGRLRQEARDVKVGGTTLPDVCALAIKDAAVFFDALELSIEQGAIAERILFEIRRRLRFMVEVGLDYLTLDRLASTLSGGEAQRIQLATNLGSSLVGALYVLDEPSIGLHPRDNDRLIALLHNLRDIGNTVLVVEHDEDMMRAADHILDIGPSAGELGGRVIYEGDFKGLMVDESSLTARYLRGESEIKEPKQRRTAQKRRLTLRGASEHNLKSIDVEFPLDMLVCVTGVSGSGKSTLIHDCIYAGLKKQRGDWQGHVGAFSKLGGSELIDDVILVDQSPIGRTPRSNPVTYIKVYDGIREVFSGTREAQAHGFDPSHFSFNLPGGRCDVCQGDGTVTVEMQFLADVELVCEECKGTRFKQQILDVRYRGKNVHEVLNMTVREAITFFREVPKITNRLRVLDEVGLGYLRLGQSATTLSGGEAQRIKLAAQLSKRTGAKTLYIFDEPTTGLHFDDINKLLAAFRALIDAGGSLLVIEHNLDVIKTADYIIDLGPEGGDAGGQIVATGTPEKIMASRTSHTGRYLKAHLAKSNGKSQNGTKVNGQTYRI